MTIKLIKGYEKIAAGEVIERPASVVKELMENAIDAGATQIFITVTNAGKDLIQISDNGCGIAEEELEIAFQRHTSSKIDSADELDSIHSLGFRGEALASIAAVSQIEVTSRPSAQPHGVQLSLEPEKAPHTEPCGAPVGTTIKVKNLFYNLPVRQKFLRSNRVELGHITDVITRYALAYPLAHIKLDHNGLTLINSPQYRGEAPTVSPNTVDTAIISPAVIKTYEYAVQNIYGKSVVSHLVPIQLIEQDYAFFGFIGHPDIARSDRKASSVFLNHRLITNAEIYQIVAEAYKDYLMRQKYPFFILYLSLPPANVDFNVHPSKRVIKFVDEAMFLAELQASLASEIKRAIRQHFQDANQPQPAKRGENASMDFWTPPSQATVQSTPPAGDLAQASGGLSEGGDWGQNGDGGQKNENQGDSGGKTATSRGGQTKRAATWLLHSPTSHTHTAPSPARPPRLGQSSQTHFGRPTPRAKTKQTTIYSVPAAESPNNPDRPVTEAGFLPVRQLPPLHLLNAGIQAGNNYLIFQTDDELIIIDQHAAHERINYERVQKWAKLDQVPIQRLLMPIKIDVAPHETEFVKDAAANLMPYGFELEYFGANTFILRSVPALIKAKAVPQQLIIDLCMEIIHMGQEKSLSDMKREILQYMGCHKSIRAGDEIWSRQTIKKLIADLDRCENPHHCAHGRPTYIKIPFTDLDKWFHRT